MESSDGQSPFDCDFDDFVERMLRERHVPGVSVAVIDSGVIYSKGYGYAKLPDVHATADTQWMTGSTTKPMLAVATALLVHDNEQYPDISWTTPIKGIIPEDFVLSDDYATYHNTIEDAFVHRTGMPRHDLVHGHRDQIPADVVRSMRHLPLTYELRQSFVYCPLMYGALTHLLEVRTGRKLEDHMRERLWKPLGMSSTTLVLPARGNPRFATGYWWHETSAEFLAERLDDVLSISGSGAVVSTVNDYALWMRNMLEAHAGTHDMGSPITPEIVHDLFTPRNISMLWQSKYIPYTYALGWFVGTIFSETVIFHGGDETGFGTNVHMLPDKGYGVVTMTNTRLGGDHPGEAIAEYLMSRKLRLDTTSNKATDFLSAQFVQPSLPARPVHHSIRRPSPCKIAELAGRYSHPACGDIDLLYLKAGDTDEGSLEGFFYPRTWPLKIRLSHLDYTTFIVECFDPHGLGNIAIGEGIVWQARDLVGKDQCLHAVFELREESKMVRTMGIELEPSMIEMARRLEPEKWRQGMYWFEKISNAY